MAQTMTTNTVSAEADTMPNHGVTVEPAYIAPALRALAFPLRALNFAPNNARAHADADLAALSESLRAHGHQKPIVAKRTYRGVENAVICGNGTLETARHLKWSHLAVSWFEGSDDDARVFALRDNRTAELSEWDTDQLALLAAGGVDLLSLWHDDEGLASLLGAAAPVPTFEPEKPAHRLDELADNTTCPACGHRWHQGAR